MTEFEKYHIKFVEISIDCYDIDDMTAAITKYRPCIGVVLHVRSRTDEEELFQADEDLLAILNQMKFREPMVLHCFSGNANLAARYLRENEHTYFGIGGTITFPGNEMLEAAVQAIPANRLLLETDGPYLKPFYPDGTRPPGKRNSSLNLPIIIDKLASILAMTPMEVEKLTAENACEFYKLSFEGDSLLQPEEKEYPEMCAVMLLSEA